MMDGAQYVQIWMRLSTIEVGLWSLLGRLSSWYHSALLVVVACCCFVAFLSRMYFKVNKINRPTLCCPGPLRQWFVWQDNSMQVNETFFLMRQSTDPIGTWAGTHWKHTTTMWLVKGQSPVEVRIVLHWKYRHCERSQFGFQKIPLSVVGFSGV